MQETLIHYLWSLQYFDRNDLRTTQGDPLEIFHPGILNSNSGPDFSNARLRIGGINWVGNVEAHIQSSGWLDHHHDQDPAYDSVILHVVWSDDKAIARRDNTGLPTLELRNRVHHDLIHKYRQLVGSSFTIPCQRTFPSVDKIVKQSMIEKALVQRLERKAIEVHAMLKLNGNNWEETTWQLLARAFGFKINADPMFQLSKSIPLKLLHKQQQLLTIEALLLGQAGFLDGSRGDTYFLGLKKEYGLLAHMYSIAERKMSKVQWKFLRLRPPNFPTLRIAQLAAIVQKRRTLFSDMVEVRSVKDLVTIFAVPPGDYWIDHYQFSKKSANRVHELGQGSAEILVVNSVVPLLAAYAGSMDDQSYMDRALSLLEQLSPEQNTITQRWTDLGMGPRNSFESQGLIELFNTFCQRKSCLHCTIGASVIRPPEDELPRTDS